MVFVALCFVHLQDIPCKTHSSEPGCSQKESKCAHASLHMSSISSLSLLPLSPSLPLSLFSSVCPLENDVSSAL